MKEYETPNTSAETERPTTRQIGDRILRITYLPDGDPDVVNEQDGVDHEFIGRSDLHRLHAAVANSKRRLVTKPSKSRKRGR